LKYTCFIQYWDALFEIQIEINMNFEGSDKNDSNKMDEAILEIIIMLMAQEYTDISKKRRASAKKTSGESLWESPWGKMITDEV
jgi:hypothetical protein